MELIGISTLIEGFIRAVNAGVEGDELIIKGSPSVGGAGIEDVEQQVAVIEAVAADGRNGAGDADGFQTGAAQEGVFSDGGDAFGEENAPQGGAA